MLGEDVAGIQHRGQTLLSSLPGFPGLHSFFLLTFLFHSITLIVLSSEEDTLELKLERLLQMVFGAMVRFSIIFSQTQESELSAFFSLRPPTLSSSSKTQESCCQSLFPQTQESRFPAPSSFSLSPAPPILEPVVQASTLLYGSSRFFLWDLKN